MTQKISSHTTSRLIERISNGRKWLIIHTDHPQYPQALKLYEELVTEARKRGLSEEECWQVDSLTPDEIKDIFNVY